MRMVLNGKKVDATNHCEIPVYNPATHKIIDTVPNATEKDVDLALDYAKQGAKIWGRTPVGERVSILIKAAGILEENSKEMADLLCAELGRPYKQCLDEAASVGETFRSFAEKAKHSCCEMLPSDVTDMVVVKREPLGVVACIIPFNFPIGLYAFKAAPALAAGNAVIVKPASVTPLASIFMTELLLRAGIPPQALQIITGSGEKIGAQLAASPKINAISLTGSTEVGLSVAERASRNLTRVFLELGGYDPLIIMKDADLDLAVRETIKGRMFNAGQVCCASKRVLVQKSIAEEYTNRLINALKLLKVCEPHEKECDMGPLVSEQAACEVENKVNQTIKQGARCVFGGKRYNKTYFEPTVLKDVTADMDIAKDMEIFGPVVPIIEFEENDEAIKIANQTKYGLSGGVIGRDIKAALSTALKLESGTTVVNGCGDYRTLYTPFGGHKMSGIGTEGLMLTLEEMMLTKCVALKGIVEESVSESVLR